MHIEIISIISIIELILVGIGWIGFIILIGSVLSTISTQSSSSGDSDKGGLLFIPIFLIVGLLLGLCTWLAHLLRTGVNTVRRDSAKIQQWFNIHMPLLIIGLILSFFEAFLEPGSLLMNILPTLYRIWTLYIARRFLKKLREESAEGDGCSELTNVQYAH